MPPGLSVATYCLIAGLAYGAHLPTTSTSLPPCGCGDVASQVWFTAWPAYAMRAGLNPFYSTFVAYPHGINMMTNTGAPLLGIIFAPLTLLAGPMATYSLLMRLAFAFSAISICIVLRRWTTWWPAAFAGGLLYGFSPFMIGQGTAHLFLTFAPLPPLMLALLDDVVIRQKHPLRNGILLGIALVAQLLISPEVLVITAVLGALGLLVLVLRHPVAARERLRVLATGAAATIGAFAVLGAYPLWVYFRGPFHVYGSPHSASQLSAYHSAALSLVVPNSLQRLGFASWFARGAVLAQGNPVEHTSYLGIPLLLFLVVLAVRFRHSGLVQLFTLLAVVAWSLTLGSVLYLDRSPNPAIKLPYDLLTHLPVVNGSLDLRYSLVMYLAVAVVLAVGLDRVRIEGLIPRRAHRVADTTRRQRLLLIDGACALVAGLALLPLLPTLPYATTAVHTPAVFTSADSPITSGAVVLSYPLPVGYIGANDQALLWQADAGMRFKLIGFRGAVAGSHHQPLRNVALLLHPRAAELVLAWALYGRPAPPPDDGATTRSIRTFLARYDVSDVSVQRTGLHWPAVLRYYSAALGTPPVRFGRTYVFSHVQRDLGSVTAT